ncbi:MAG: SusC/RagA family TonB-linked outer membrane protein [Gemmatimonadetes bacterium]|nr:SusC/RagA family TonB-linked outer membrane protein [Gemmatimonadota bacterium]
MIIKRAMTTLVFAALAAGLGMAPLPLAAQATGSIRGRVVESGTQRALSGAQVVVGTTALRTVTSASGEYTIANVPAGSYRVRAALLGHGTVERTVAVTAGATAEANFTLTPSAVALDALVVTALGQTTEQRAVATAQQTVRGPELAETQRESFVNALQGRVAGVEVTSTSGVPGASSSITIRGISSISGSNQPLMIVDGLPLDNKTLSTNSLASDAPGSSTLLANRTVDFTNRAADINPEDIETLTVLKGPAAAALYGIDAANGAIVITTKRGKAGQGGIQYNNSFRIESTRARPEIQRVYGVSGVGGSTFQYFGAPYPEGTQFYDNIDGFFETAVTQKHNLTFSGANADNKMSYRLSGGYTKQNGVVPGTRYDRINVTGASQAQVNRWLNADLSMQYINAANDQAFKGVGGPLIGLLMWPQTDRASDYLTPAGTRRRVTSLGPGAEIDNPYFNVEKNSITSRNDRVMANLGLVISPFSWGNLRTNLGVDAYTNQNQILRHPESNYGITNNGIIDIATDVTRNLTSQTLLNFNSREITSKITVNGFVGNAVQDLRSRVDASQGLNFLEPDFVSINNAAQRNSFTTIAQRRLVSALGSVTFDYDRYFFVTVTGRNDWTSTIPKAENSFFYPGISSALVFSDAFPRLGDFMRGKIRASYAQSGKDARPYAYRPSLENKPTSYGGYGYGFYGPNFELKPEFAHEYELGTELGFFDDRLGLDVTVYRKQTENQIVNDIRGSYATGFVLFNLNGADTRNEGLEVTLRATPVQRNRFSWDFEANFDRSRGKTISLPRNLPESYVSDTWLFGNVRAGNAPGLSTRSLTGRYYLRNNAGQILIDPTTGLPLVSTTFIDAGYDRQPDFTLGLRNQLRYRRASLSFLFDIRKGGDILNATEQFLTARGLAMNTLDRDKPRVVQGVLRDGKENSANPTPNNIVIVPAVNTGYYTNISEELFIEKDVNWVRLRDVTLRLGLPQRFGRNASVFVTGTDLLLFTNYSGLDPVVNGNSAAVGGSGAQGIDYGNFPMPRGINLGISTSF